MTFQFRNPAIGSGKASASFAFGICFLAGSFLFTQGAQKPEAPNSEAQKPVPHRASSPAIESIAKQAEAAREENRVEDAIALYKKGVAIKPSWTEGWWYLGSLYYDMEKHTEAREAFHHVVAGDPKLAAGWAMLGLTEFQSREYDRSLADLRRAIELGVPDNGQLSDVASYHFALLLTRYEEYEQAMKVLSTFAQRNRQEPDFIEAMGLAALRKPLLPSEMPAGERELVMDVGRAMYDAAALRTPQAAAEFKILIEKYPNEPSVHYLYGGFLLYSDADAGLSELEKELEISPLHVPALVTIAAEYIRRQDYKSALPYAEKAVAASPPSFAAHTVLGRVLVEGDIDSARGLKELETARGLAPGSPQVRIALATAYAKLGRKEDAAREREEFQKLRKLTDAANASFP